MGTVRLIRAERVPSRCGVVVEARMESEKGMAVKGGAVMVESLLDGSGLEMECMLVEPDDSGKVSVMVSNPSSAPICLDRDQCLGEVHRVSNGVVDELDCHEKSVVSAEVGKVNLVGVNESGSEVNVRREKLNEMLLFGSECDAIREAVLEAEDVFAIDEGERGEVREVQHDIVTGDSPPIRQQVRRVPFALRDKVTGMVNDMLRDGVVSESCSPWASPVVLVKKKNGDLRFCVDYRRLNAVTRKDVFPIPRIDDLLDQLSGKKVFSTLDAKSGYWQIQMDPKARQKTAFITQNGLYEFNVMPFGLCNAPATFQRLMQQVLAGLESFCSVYIDDIIVFSEAVEEHVDHLRQIFARLRRFFLKLHPAKCKFARVPGTYYLRAWHSSKPGEG